MKRLCIVILILVLALSLAGCGEQGPEYAFDRYGNEYTIDWEASTISDGTNIYEFTYEGEEEAKWIVDTKVALSATPNGRKISISWPKTYSGEFTLRYGSASRKVIVESLF